MNHENEYKKKKYFLLSKENANGLMAIECSRNFIGSFELYRRNTSFLRFISLLVFSSTSLCI